MYPCVFVSPLSRHPHDFNHHFEVVNPFLGNASDEYLHDVDCDRKKFRAMVYLHRTGLCSPDRDRAEIYCYRTKSSPTKSRVNLDQTGPSTETGSGSVEVSICLCQGLIRTGLNIMKSSTDRFLLTLPDQDRAEYSTGPDRHWPNLE